MANPENDPNDKPWFEEFGVEDPRTLARSRIFTTFLTSAKYILTMPRDPLTEGCVEQFHEEAGCVANVLLGPELHLLWGLSLLVTSPFSKKE